MGSRGGILLSVLTLQMLLLSPAEASGESEAVVRTVTLEEAVASADRAPGLVAARAGEQAAEAALRVAHLLPDLETSLITNSITARLSAEVLVPLPWPARGPRIAAGTATLLSAGRVREDVRAAARQAVRAAWFTLAAAGQRAGAAADRDARARRIAGAVTSLYEEGRVARLDVVRANAEAALALSDRGAADETLRSAGAVLATLMDLNPGAGVRAAPPFPDPEIEPGLEECLAQAREMSPAVQRQAAEVDVAEAQWKLASRLRSPSFGVNLGADWDDPTEPGTNVFAGLSIGIPIAAPATTSVALSDLDRQGALLEQVRREAAVAAEIAWGATRASRLRYETIDRVLMPAAREAAELTRLAYREGKVDIFRLLDSERLLSDAEVSRVDTYEAWGLAHADLLRATAQDAP